MTSKEKYMQRYSDDDIQTIAYAVIQQAVDDWRSLCRGNPEEKDCNFKELEVFFKTGCAILLGNSDTANRIFKQMKLERKRMVTR